MPARVGVEVEFAGLDFDEAADVIAAHLGAPRRPVSRHEALFEADDGAPYRLEVDFELLKRLSREEAEEGREDPLRRFAIAALDAAAAVATPLELVTPPLAPARLGDLDELLGALGAAGAVGTDASLIYAFGVHLNPEAEPDPERVLAHLRAFLCLYDWLEQRDGIDLSRKFTAFIDPFPREYELRVLAADYRPSAAAFIDDYLAANPTRNRALDLLPLLAEMDGERVATAVSDRRIRARPTYHYRLPSSRVGEAGWSILRPWNDWLAVERLAADDRRLGELCRQRVAHQAAGPFQRRQRDWIAQCARTVDAL